MFCIIFFFREITNYSGTSWIWSDGMKLYWLVPLVLAGVVLAVYLLFMGLYYPTSSPTGFCARCHYIKPYVESWQESKHAGINCVHCHEHRGFSGKLESKARGSNYFYQHITRQYTMPTKAVVFEQNCIGCHVGDNRRFAQAPRMTNISVNHYEIIRENRSCLECHRDTGHEVNILVTPELTGLFNR